MYKILLSHEALIKFYGKKMVEQGDNKILHVKFIFPRIYS
jgi:hypothetical protein